ncbi:bifunctional riboflavin kinase/FAD synthetase [bacterium]|nr:bifunctional riboflavin kinase/FAD synthetase [bacterium]
MTQSVREDNKKTCDLCDLSGKKMDIIHSSTNFKIDTQTVLTIGNFDGAHIGHQEIIQRIVRDSKKYGYPSLVYTFSPHPAKVFAPGSNFKLIQTEKQKLASLEALGIDICVVEKFDKQFAKQSSDDFFNKIVLKKFRAKKVITGYDLTFGKMRSGTTSELSKLCKQNDIEFEIVQPIFYEDLLISSSQIRSFLSNGRVALVQELLGRPYTIEGTIVEGHGRGNKLGIHTANLSPDNELIPKEGVYITKTHTKGIIYPSVTNIGKNPTFNDDSLSIETHIFDFCETLYGEHIEIDFIKFHRDEKRFKNAEELASQINKDIQKARFYYEKTKS